LQRLSGNNMRFEESLAIQDIIKNTALLIILLIWASATLSSLKN